MQTAEAFSHPWRAVPVASPLAETHMEARPQAEASLYLAEPEVLLECIGRTPDECRHLMLVGHNPGLLELASLLAPATRLSGFETGATCTMLFAATHWQQLQPGRAEALYYDAPSRQFEA